MSFLGIITNQKNEEYMKKIISKYFPVENIIFITDKNINNVKNVRFETILMDKKIKNVDTLKKIIINTKYLILNSDLDLELYMLKNLKLTVISYGFNNKATFTISSISDNKIIIFLQRIMSNIQGKKYDPQEFALGKEENKEINSIIGANILKLMYKENSTI